MTVINRIRRIRLVLIPLAAVLALSAVFILPAVMPLHVTKTYYVTSDSSLGDFYIEENRTGSLAGTAGDLFVYYIQKYSRNITEADAQPSVMTKITLCPCEWYAVIPDSDRDLMRSRLKKVFKDEVFVAESSVSTETIDVFLPSSCLSDADFSVEELTADLSVAYRYILTVTPYARWETEAETQEYGEYQCDIKDLPEKTDVFEFRTSADRTEDPEGWNAGLLSIRKMMDRIGLPYALGVLYEDSRCVAVRTVPGKFDESVLSRIMALGAPELSGDAGNGDLTILLESGSFSAEILPNSDGGLKLAVILKSDVQKEQLRSLSEHILVSDAENVIRLRDNGKTVILETETDEIIGDGILEFYDFSSLNMEKADQEHRYVLEILCDILNGQLPGLSSYTVTKTNQ